jgi:serine/threonine-protein kinase
MLSGRLPFEGATVFETSNAILNADPPPLMSVAPRVPAELARLVDRLLSKEPGGRFETSDELLAELRKVRRPGESAEWPISGDASERPSMGGALERLSADAVSGRKIIRDASGASDSAPVPPVSRSGSRRWAASGSGRWTAAAGPQGPSIAVLPLASLSSDVENEYFSEGLSEDLINALARIPGLNVASRTSAFFFKDKKMDIREIASILGVETLLEGSVRKVGDRIRVTVQLVNAVDGYHIWSESYDRHLEDIFAIQDDISRTIAETLEVTLLGPRDQPLVRRHTQDIEAYKLYLQGRYHWNRRYRGGMQTAIRCFREAMEKDPAFALPYSGLADSLAILAFYNYLPAQEGFPKAKAAAQAALQIDDTNAEAHGSLGFVTSFYDWDWEAGDAEFVRALELKPDYGTGHWWYASALMVRGRGEDSDRELRLALEAEPLSAIISGGASFHLYFRREYDKGADRARRSLELDPDFGPSHAFLAWNYMELGRYDEALPEWQRAIELLEGLPLVRAMLGINLARSGDEEGAGEILAELTADEAASRAVYPYHLAILSAALRQKDAAFEWLEYAYETRNNWLAFLRIDPSIDPLRGDPRLDDLIGRVGLPED